MEFDRLAKNVKAASAEDKKWKEWEETLKEGYFGAKKKNALQRAVVDLERSSRGREYKVKSNNCKKAQGYLIIPVDDTESVRFFSEEGCTASIPEQAYKQHVHWTKDNRCKPDRGIFISHTPKIESILFKQEPLLEGILVIIEYIKRDAQYIHGTPYVWLPSDRDFFVPACYPRAFIHYRDEKAPPSTQTPSSSSTRYDVGRNGSNRRESSDRDRSRRDRSRERESRRDRDREHSRSHRDLDRYESRDSTRYDRGRSDREYDRRDSYDRGSSRRDSYRNYETNGHYNRSPSPPPSRYSSRSERNKSPDRHRREDRYESDRRGGYDRREQQQQQQQQRQRQWEEPPVQHEPPPADSRWPEPPPRNGFYAQQRQAPPPPHQQQHQHHHHHHQPDPHRLQQQPLAQQQPIPPPNRHQPINQIPKTPKLEKKPEKIEKQPMRDHEVIKVKLRNRRRRTPSLWTGQVTFDPSGKFGIKADLVGTGPPAAHRLAESRLHFGQRIPTVYAGDLIKTFHKLIKSFGATYLIKSDAFNLDGYWTAFPLQLEPALNPNERQRQTDILKNAFGIAPLLMARTQSSNLRVFMMKRDLLKGIPQGAEWFYNNQVVARYVVLIHSPVSGPCSGRELREFQTVNRATFTTQAIYNISPHKFLPNLPQLTQTGVSDCMRSCDDARNALDSFVRQLEEYWRLDSEHFEEVNALTCDELSARETNRNLQQKVFSADRHASLLSLIKRKFNERALLIEEILVETERLKEEAKVAKQRTRPMSPPPMPTPTLAAQQTPPPPSPQPMSLANLAPPQPPAHKETTPRRAPITPKRETNGEPAPKLRILEPKNESFLRDLEKQKRQTELALVKEAITPKHATNLEKFRFVNLVTMHHKGARLPDMVGEEAWNKYQNLVRKKSACRLPDWFLAKRTIKLLPDESGERVPTISCTSEPVKKCDTFEHEPNPLKRVILRALPPPPPVKEFESKFGLDGRSPIVIKGQRHVPINFTPKPPPQLDSEAKKLASHSLSFVRITHVSLQKLRLGMD